MISVVLLQKTKTKIVGRGEGLTVQFLKNSKNSGFANFEPKNCHTTPLFKQCSIFNFKTK